MAEKSPDFGLNPLEAEQLELSGYCGVLLGNIIPQLLRRSDEAQKDLLYQGAADIDVALLAYDYLVDGLQSYRIRLVRPRYSENQPKFKNFGIVRQVIINIPVDFVQDPRTATDIELALLTIYVDTERTTVAQKYAVCPKRVIPYTNFSDLDFDFYTDEKTGVSHVANVKYHKKDAVENDSDAIERQLVDIKDIYNTMSQLIIGNQSLNDGTALEG